MDEINLLELIKRRFAALLANVHPRADPKLAAEVPATLAQTDSDLPAVFMRARRVLEIIVLDIYRRELPTAKPKPLADMIEALYAQQGLVSKRVAADLHYIRVNGNLIIHPQDEAVAIRPGDAEPVLLVFLSVVEWYLTVYLPERLGEAPARAPTLPPPPNPYRGLLAFREADAGNWFGREPDADDLLAAVARQPLVAVVGPSGSGKSSLVYAGVVPGLRATAELRIADFRPRGRPFAELAQALIALWPIDPTDRLAQARKLAAHLAEGRVTLTDAVQETLRQSGGSRLLLIADQFEELYTLGQSGDDTQGFMDLLAQAAQDGLAIPNRAGPPELCLLLTLRADFLGHALAHPGLAALLDRCPPKLLGPVEDRARLRAIIEQPARGVGVVLEDLLPERILRDLAQLPGTVEQVGGASLPLLEFTLAQLWDQQEERRLTHRGYEALGGIQQALSRHADGVLARLDLLDQARMRHVLVQMVRPGEGTEDTRQVATRDQLRPDDWPLVVRLADADTRLVVTGHDETTDQDTAEIVHETLIRHWQPLRDWIDADRAFRLWQNGLRQAMAEWERTGRDDGALLAGARLAEAEERIAARSQDVSEREWQFVATAILQRDRLAQKERRTRQRLKRLAGTLAVLAIFSLTAAGGAISFFFVAERNARSATEELYSNLLNQAYAKRDIEGSLVTAKHLFGRIAAEAPLSSQGQLARISYQALDLGRLTQFLELNSNGEIRHIGPGLAHILEAHGENEARVVRIQHDEAETVASARVSSESLAGEPSPNGTRYLLWAENATFLVDLTTGDLDSNLPSCSSFSGCRFFDDDTIVMQIEPRVLALFAVDTRSARLHLLHDSDVSGFQFSGEILLSWDDAGKLYKWDLRVGKRISEIETGRAIFTGELSAHGGRALTRTWSGEACLWNMDAGHLLQCYDSFRSQYFPTDYNNDGPTLEAGFAFSPSGTRLLLWVFHQGVMVASSDDGSIVDYYPSDSTVFASFDSSDDRYVVLNWAGEVVLNTIGSDERTKVLYHRYNKAIIPTDVFRQAGFFLNDGRYATFDGNADDSVVLWNLSEQQQVSQLLLGDYVGYAYSDRLSGELVAASEDARSVKAWNVTLPAREAERAAVRAPLPSQESSIFDVTRMFDVRVINAKVLIVDPRSNEVKVELAASGTMFEYPIVDSGEAVFDATGRFLLVSGGFRSGLEIWDLRDGLKVFPAGGGYELDSLRSASIIDERNVVAFQDTIEWVTGFDFGNGKLRFRAKLGQTDGWAVLLDEPSESIVAFKDKSVWLWDGRAQAITFRYSHHKPVRAAWLGGDGKVYFAERHSEDVYRVNIDAEPSYPSACYPLRAVVDTGSVLERGAFVRALDAQTWRTHRAKLKVAEEQLLRGEEPDCSVD